MDQMVGSRRSPVATILGARLPNSSVNHRFLVPPSGSELRDGLGSLVVGPCVVALVLAHRWCRYGSDMNL